MNRFAAMDAFVRVVDTGSFTGASRQLRVGQPAVSKMIATRKTYRSEITPAHDPRAQADGSRREFLRACEARGREADEAEAKARGVGATLTGRLRIFGAVTLSRLHIVPRLPRFMALHPALDVEVFLDDNNVDLIEAGIDVALRMGDLQNSSLTARKIVEGRRVVLAAPRYFEAREEPETPAELVGHEAVIYDQRGGGTQWSFTQDASKTAVTIRGRMRNNAAEAVREAVIAGLGLAVTSEWMFSPELVLGQIRRVLTDWELPPVGLWVLFPTGRHTTGSSRPEYDARSWHANVLM